MGSIAKDPENTMKVAVAPIAKFLSQADLLSSGGENKIEFAVVGQEIRIHDSNVDCKVKFEGKCQEFDIPMNSAYFKPIIGHVDAETINICPAIQDDVVSGLVIWTDNLTVAVGSVEEE